MHETAIVMALLEQVRAFLPEACVLEKVFVEVGALEHLEPEVLATVWSAFTCDTRCEGSTLVVERVPLSVRCRRCGREYDPEDIAILLCPWCGAVAPEVLRGAGVVLRSLEVEEEAEP